MKRSGEPPAHGGDLAWASRTFGVPLDSWQDLSTGISPWSYPAPPVPAPIWQRLPEGDQRLRAAASAYYGVAEPWLNALPGSQYAIARLPRWLPAARVALPVLGYSEHRRAWSAAGHQVVDYRDAGQLLALVQARAVEHLVVINPNNPSAERLERAFIARLHDAHDRRGLLLVDEAFADLYPESSALPLIDTCPDLWVLRSLGKFFGLAGLRLGFLAGRDGHWPLREPLATELAPWGVSHPAQWLGAQALTDRSWQAQQHQRLTAAGAALAQQWQDYFAQPPGLGRIAVHNAGLFVTLRGPRAPLCDLYQHLGRAGLLLRWGHEAPRGEAWLRAGLPPDGGRRLAEALEKPSARHR
ncbi:threonine-phosphate decarboxylase [Marinimicrobium alkaliphilum]|uniref:threonine-phosphate decarboxylase n=1 Tax=Marinimicrobium alkaliphilum TaxID=2202654 RepID=UPI0013004204|nr:threonine-phosphate decarboxylase [Marinimicrobium alkaliphilum]